MEEKADGRAARMQRAMEAMAGYVIWAELEWRGEKEEERLVKKYNENQQTERSKVDGGPATFKCDDRGINLY